MLVVTLHRQDDILVIRAYDTGRWLVASGPAFPAFAVGNGFPRPHDGATFFRTDLDAWYTWGEAGAAWTIVGGASGAPADAEYVTSSASGSLSAERVLTDTATVTWDFSVAGQAKANASAAPAPDNDARFLALAGI